MGEDGVFAHAEADRCQNLDADGTVVDVNAVIDLEGLRIVCGDAGAFEMNLAGNEPGAVTSTAGKLTFIAGKQGIASGYGFQPGSQAEVWLASDPIYLGTTVVEADGTWTLVFDVPADLESGEHTIQAEGIAENGEPRALSAGVLVASETNVTLPATGVGNNVVLFALLLIFAGLLAAVRSRTISE